MVKKSEQDPYDMILSAFEEISKSEEERELQKTAEAEPEEPAPEEAVFEEPVPEETVPEEAELKAGAESTGKGVTLKPLPEKSFHPEKLTDSTVPAAAEPAGGEGKSAKKKLSKGKKILISILAVFLAAVIALGVFVGRKFYLLGSNIDDYFGGEISGNDIDASDIDSITDAESLTALLSEWYNNGGDHMYSKYVKNILLIGVDSDSKLADSMILISINRRTEELNMVSFYRDSFTYMEDAKGNGYFGKLNSAYKYGGANDVVETIENDYKIRIDDYALVNYDTFPDVIDALGGVDVEVTEKEAAYLNKTWKNWTRTGNKIQFTAGVMHMDGEHALMFSRIRKLDSDVNRTERQRRVIEAIITKLQSASVSELNDVIDTVLPNVKTSMRNSEIVSFATTAVTQGYLKYPITQTSMPTEEYCEEGYAGTEWIWICDFEGAAYELQMLLYGQSNITLSEDRVSALDFSKGKTVTTTTRQSTYTYTYSYNTTNSYYGYGTTSSYYGGGTEYSTDYYDTTTAYVDSSTDTTTASGGGFWWLG